jgi:hypothetical protein
LDPLPLLIGQPKQVAAHDPNPLPKTNQDRIVRAEKLMSSDPRTVGLACSPFPSSIRFMYHPELTAKESRTPPMIRAKIGDSLIDLPTLNSQKNSIEKSFDLEPRQLQSAIETGSFDFTEMFDQSMIKTPSRVVRFSTLGLSENIFALESKCASKGNSNQ